MVNNRLIERQMPVLGIRKRKIYYFQLIFIVLIVQISFSAHPLYQKFGFDSLKTMSGKVDSIDSISIKPYKVYHFSYSNTKDENNWPYGAGIAITKINGKKESAMWFYWLHGDFPPHTIEWIDFNGDKEKDLWILAGFEDEFESLLYINKLKEDGNLKILYNNNHSYSALIDIDKDKLPEIMDAGVNPATEPEETWVKENDNLNAEIDKEYKRIVGQYDKCNFDYNMPNAYKKINLSPYDKFRIFKVKGMEAIEITKDFPIHIRWRTEVLDKVIPENEMTKEGIKETKDYLENLLKCRN
jgi:hypothetical protein